VCSKGNKPRGYMSRYDWEELGLIPLLDRITNPAEIIGTAKAFPVAIIITVIIIIISTTFNKMERNLNKDMD
jgi:hypothetical protein